MAGRVVERLTGVKRSKGRGKTMPWWKKRLTNHWDKRIEKGNWKVESLQNNTIKNKHLKAWLQAQYNIKVRGYKVIIEELKQRVLAKSQRIKRYESRDWGAIPSKLTLRKHESKEIVSAPGKHRKVSMSYRKLKHLDSFGREPGRKMLSIMKKALSLVWQWKDRLRKQAIKLSGPDGLQGYWVKNIKCLHQKMSEMLNNWHVSGDVPAWLTKGKTVLIMD